MSWLSSFLVAVVTGVVGALLSGVVANLATGWYQVTNREGQAGYFILSMGFLGFLGGFAVGLVVSRLVAGSASRGAFKAIGISVGVVLVALTAIGVTSRQLADVPPDMDGEPLWLLVEIRFPAAHPSPVEERREIRLFLGSVGRFSREVRVRKEGVLWLDEARRDGESWVVPGAVEIFTSRGRRFLEVGVDDKPMAAFLAPIPAHPGPKEREWSGWLSASDLTYRTRVQKKSEPLRRETYGPFEIETVAHDLSRAEPRDGLLMGADSQIRVSHRGKPVEVEGAPGTRFGRPFQGALSVMAVAAPKTALLIHVPTEESRGALHLVTEESGEVRSLFLCETGGRIEVRELTSDPGRPRASRRARPSGWFDRVGLDHPGLYLLDGGMFVDGRVVLETTRLAAYKVPEPKELSGGGWGAPLALSPDGRSFVRLVTGESPSLLVSNFVAGRAYVLPIDRRRMRYLTSSQVDPGWIDHHFAWTREDGTDTLAQRPGFAPLPYRGELSFMVGETRGPITYYLWGAGEEMKKAIADLLIAEMKAEPLPARKDPRFRLLRIEGREVRVYASTSDPAVVDVSVEGGEAGNGLVSAIGAHIDAALATGKYDTLFRP
jgi:hypothetical protein